ncbi:uncharacterized protein FIBRA_03579 [Fibroporia radiculosa]|uniref:PI-PLC Y-box domain-containing protein n=1 Tax=Fibroporia radiculosa TaxID=599839 RepID=J4G5Y4_9APHY|nr:uncharacterized protein FIBRA_03579 [Fibroporia radiculosa]CCM01523.1 predicted protein [Fibroporia radiculosa]
MSSSDDYNIFGAVTGALGTMGLVQILWVVIKSQLPSSKLKVFDQTFEETESLLRLVSEEGIFVNSDYIAVTRRDLIRIRARSEKYRNATYCATTFWKQLKGIVTGLSRKISVLCDEVVEVRANISSTTEETRNKLGGERGEQVTLNWLPMSPTAEVSPTDNARPSDASSCSIWQRSKAFIVITTSDLATTVRSHIPVKASPASPDEPSFPSSSALSSQPDCPVFSTPLPSTTSNISELQSSYNATEIATAPQSTCRRYKYFSRNTWGLPRNVRRMLQKIDQELAARDITHPALSRLSKSIRLGRRGRRSLAALHTHYVRATAARNSTNVERCAHDQVVSKYEEDGWEDDDEIDMLSGVPQFLYAHDRITIHPPGLV